MAEDHILQVWWAQTLPVLQLTAPWAAALVINVAKSTLVSSVVKTTLGTATTELITPARWTWIDHLAHGL